MRVQDIIGRLRSEGTELPPKELLEEQVLERLIIEEIQLQIGDSAGVKISDAELNRALSMLASQNSMNLEQFKESLDANNELLHQVTRLSKERAYYPKGPKR